MTNCIDYLFWSYYCFCNRHPKIYFGDNVWQAIVIMYVTIAAQCGLYYALISTFLTFLPVLPKAHTFYGELLAWLFATPILLILNHRYCHNKTITAGNFKYFKTKWGNDPRKNTKKRIVVLLYTIYSTLGVLLLAIII